LSYVILLDTSHQPDSASLEVSLGKMESFYANLKTDLLAAGANASMALKDMEQALRRFSAMRRAAQQFYKSRRRLLKCGNI